MIPIRASATAVEAFRLFMQPDNDWMSLEALEAQILGRSPESPAMRVGTSFGGLIEHGGAELVDARGDYRFNGITFEGASMREALNRYDRRGLFEVKGTKLYGDVLVVAKADQMLGAQLVETKTTTSGFDFEKYAASAQWRLMADMFRPLLITYRVAVLGELAPESYTVREFVEFNVFPYPALHADCVALVEQFRAFVVSRGLDQPLRERQARAEAA